MTVVELVTDRQGMITGATDEAAALFGIERRWLLRKPLATFVAEADRRRFRMFVLELQDGSSPATAAFVFESRSGVRVPTEAAGTVTPDGICWTLTANRETRVADAAGPRAAVRERLFERVLTRLPQGVVLVDRELRVLYVNPAARRVLGGDVVRVGEPLGEPFAGFSLRDAASSLFTGRPHAGAHLLEVEGRTVCVEGLSAIHTPAAVLMVEDVTERERRHRAERQFVENAAHELRTPAAAIAGAVDVLEAGAKDDEAARDRFLAHIQDQSQRLSRLTASLLTLARIQTGQESPTLDLVPAKPLLEALAAELGPEDGVTVRVIAPDDAAVLADRELVYQALANVGANAARHTAAGSIVLEARDLGRTIELEIRDTGAGMTPENRNRAFDRFYRASNASGGSGLGLAIAEEAVEAMGGTITLHSDPGAGTRVRVGLPSAKIAAR